jgi:hypothetical protein
MSCVAEAKAAANAISANMPIAFLGSVSASPAKLMTRIVWHSRIQLRRRPSLSSSGSGTRSTSGDHRNLNE